MSPSRSSLWCWKQVYVDTASQNHDDVIKWKHFPRNWPFVRGIHRSPVNSPHKGQWRGALMFTLICARINGWVNTREAGDLRRYRPHYDVIVMMICLPPKVPSIVICLVFFSEATLQWRHNERDGVSNHQRIDCLLNSLFERRWKNTSKFCVVGLSLPE